MLSRSDAAAVLKEYSVLLDLTEENDFRSKTFANAARQLEIQSEPLADLIEANKLESIRGFGKSVSLTIRTLAETGTFEDLERVRKEVPQGVLDLMQIEGLGPKKAKVLWKQAGIISILALEEAIRNHTLPQLPGLGEKTLEKFLFGIEFLQKHSGRRLRHKAVAESERLNEILKHIAGVQDVFFGGSLRRGCETVGDLDTIIIAEPSAIESVREAVLHNDCFHWTDSASSIMRGETSNGIAIELSVIAPAEAPYRKLLATGSKEHLADLKILAARTGLVLAENGLSDSVGKLIPAETEDDLYRALKLESVPAPMREPMTILRKLGEGCYPNPVQLKDFRGIIHNHTTFSDGHNTLREMTDAMIKMGYEYLGIADHSQVAAYANGLTPERVRRQWEEIDTLNQLLSPFRILKGIEVDILPDSSLDFDNELLAGFDYVVASIHSGFNMSEPAATERLCRALENPHVDILGHPTGRLLLKRDGYPVNHERIIACAAEHGKAIELNASPYRLDLDWRWLSLCIENNVPVPINPDAHDIDGLADIRYGVEVAAKGPLPIELCPPCWSAAKFLIWCRSHDE
jgi:DNA polymerase (family 10)